MTKMDHSLFDKRNYPIVDVQQGYDEWSTTYEQVVQDEMDLRLLNSLQKIDWSAQALILDLACGTGRIGVWLRERSNATIDGVDISSQMLKKARDKNIYRNIYAADITRTKLPDGGYDVCTQSLADEHLPDLHPLYLEVARLTKDRGHFVIVGFHPHFLMSGMPTHFNRASGESITIRSYVHLFSHHVQAAHESGWSLVEMHEGLIDDEWLRKKPKWQHYYGQPVSFAMIWQR